MFPQDPFAGDMRAQVEAFARMMQAQWARNRQNPDRPRLMDAILSGRDQVPEDAAEITLPPDAQARTQRRAERQAAGRGTVGRALLWRVAPELAKRRSLLESSTINGPEYQDWKAENEAKLAQTEQQRADAERMRGVAEGLRAEMDRRRGFETGLTAAPGVSEDPTLVPWSEVGRRLANFRPTGDQANFLPVQTAVYTGEGSKAVGEALPFSNPAYRDFAYRSASGEPQVRQGLAAETQAGAMVDRNAVDRERMVVDERIAGLESAARRYVADRGLQEKLAVDPAQMAQAFSDFLKTLPPGTPPSIAMVAFAGALGAEGGDPAAADDVVTRLTSQGNLMDLLKAKGGLETFGKIQKGATPESGFFSDTPADPLMSGLMGMFAPGLGNPKLDAQLDRVLGPGSVEGTAGIPSSRTTGPMNYGWTPGYGDYITPEGLAPETPPTPTEQELQRRLRGSRMFR